MTHVLRIKPGKDPHSRIQATRCGFKGEFDILLQLVRSLYSLNASCKNPSTTASAAI